MLNLMNILNKTQNDLEIEIYDIANNKLKDTFKISKDEIKTLTIDLCSVYILIKNKNTSWSGILPADSNIKIIEMNDKFYIIDKYGEIPSTCITENTNNKYIIFIILLIIMIIIIICCLKIFKIF